MARPERALGRDHAIAGLIGAVALGATAAVLLTGTSVGADFERAAEEQPVFDASAFEPVAVEALWDAPSAGSGPPLVTKGNLVTVDADGRLTGHDAGTGAEVWSYSHPGELCASGFYAGSVIGVYDEGAGCGTVTALDPTTQGYESTRMSTFPPGEVGLVRSFDHALLLGATRLEVWRSDLVRTVEYGEVEAPQEPGMQPRSGCELHSAGLDSGRFAVTETCPDEEGVRLTVSALVPEDSRRPEEFFSKVLDADEAWVLSAGSAGILTVERSGSAWMVGFHDSAERSHIVAELPSAPTRLPSTATIASDHSRVLWFDGTATHAFSTTEGSELWTLPDTRGPGLMLGHGVGDRSDSATARWATVPSASGTAVVDMRTGHEIRVLDTHVARTDEIVSSAQIGDVLYERRGDRVHAFKLVDGSP